MNISSALVTANYALTRRLGMKGLIGLVLIIFTLLAVLVVTPRLQQTTRRLQLQTAVQQKALNRDRRIKKVAPKSIDQLAQFNDWFPTINQNAGDLRRVLDEASKAKLDINKGDYQISTEASTEFIKYEIVFPVKANYSTLRSFVAGVLNAVPNASLAELHMERPAASNDMLDARIHFTLFYRGA
ncbi:hypothetical protein QN360_05760 [Glaciimonas sp. CA11.2]|uniref:hypothetical protein n=1 Tax=unclassified Glaciimonas TaxID=2644401 RepID=UPI002AB468CD|nr:MULTISPECIES: hypothetical protein [unclassified Glaciimonas]MDY7545095.1 hypothetical protein [Glaciimonas sp. CA11.2]MEB0011435.1 hypothetical protein [Glaciimonas sp. Cout2]MEB0081086.1 hypothetical protein [Glaciimonas sp. Gout2]MEB0162410.1 hypothetical protein [Glaciimonas sp. CA11.2]